MPSPYYYQAIERVCGTSTARSIFEIPLLLPRRKGIQVKIETSLPFNPYAASFRELKSLVAGTTGKKLPGADDLFSGRYKPLFSLESGAIRITVFCEGFVLHERDEESNVYAVDRCREVRFLDPDGAVRRITEKEFAEGPCLIPLLMVCDTRMERGIEDYEIYWHEYSTGRDRSM